MCKNVKKRWLEIKALVTGGSGFIGFNLVQKLLEKKYDVVIFDNGFRKGLKNIEEFDKNVILVKGDVSNFDEWKKLPSDIDQVFHLAAINGTKYFYVIPEKVLEVNVIGTFNCLNWISNTSVKNIFFASSSEVYGFPEIFPTPETESLKIPDPTNERFSYSSSKIMGELVTINFARKIGLDFSIARFHNIYGPDMGFEHVIPEFIRKCVNKEKFTIQGSGNETRSFCFISDAIDGILLTTENTAIKNQIFNIGTNEEIKIKDLIPLLEEIHGSKINPIFEPFAKPGTKRRIPDIAKIKKLGYSPKILLKDGLKISYDWYKNYYSKNWRQLTKSIIK